MGRPEQVAGLCRMGFNPVDIAKILDINTQSVIGYLYRAIGNRYISTSDIVLSISPELRSQIDAAVSDLNTEYWFSIYQALRINGYEPNRDLICLYLHLRGTIKGDLYFLITQVEKTLHTIVTLTLGQEYSYRYFSQLAEKAKKLQPLFSNTLNGIPDLEKAVCIRNRVMHPIPPYTPTDDDFFYVKGLRHCLVQVLATCLGKEILSDEQHFRFLLEASAQEAIENSRFYASLDEDTRRNLKTR